MADPAFLKVSPLSPDFLHRQVFFISNKILGFYHSFFCCFRTWHYLGRLWDYPWKSWEIQQVHFCFSDFELTHFWIQVLSLRWSPLREQAVLGLDPGPLRLPGIQDTSGRLASAQSAGRTKAIWDRFMSSPFTCYEHSNSTNLIECRKIFWSSPDVRAERMLTFSLSFCKLGLKGKFRICDFWHSKQFGTKFWFLMKAAHSSFIMLNNLLRDDVWG